MASDKIFLPRRSFVQNNMSMSKRLNDRSYCSAQSCLKSNLPFVEFDILGGRAQRNFRRITCPVFLIGTAPDCDLVLIDPGFPTVHAYIFIAPQQVRLQYLGNGPKTRIGQQIVEHSPLYNGDVIRTGPVAFGVRIHWQKGTEPTIESQRRFHDATMIQARINTSHHDVKRLTHIRLRNSSPRL